MVGVANNESAKFNFEARGNDLDQYDVRILLHPRDNVDSFGSYEGHVPSADGTFSVYVGMNPEKPGDALQGKIITFENREELKRHGPSSFDEEGARHSAYLDDAGSYSLVESRNTIAKNAASRYEHTAKSLAGAESGQEYLDGGLHAKIMEAIIPQGDSEFRYGRLDAVDASDLGVIREGLVAVNELISENKYVREAAVFKKDIPRMINEIDTSSHLGAHVKNLTQLVENLDDGSALATTEKDRILKTLKNGVPEDAQVTPDSTLESQQISP